MYRQAAADGGIGAYLTSGVSGSILPAYSPVGETEEALEITIGPAVIEEEPIRQGTTEWDEMDRRNQPGYEDMSPEGIQRKAALHAGALFVAGIALGYLWGGYSENKGRATL